MKKTVVKLIILLLILFAILIAIMGANSHLGLAEEMSSIQTFQSTRYLDKYLIYEDEKYETAELHVSETYNSGIKFYSMQNNEQASLTAKIKMNNTIFYIDFTNTYEIYSETAYEKSYNFEIVNSLGTIVWFATQSIIEGGSLTQNINGRITTHENIIDVDARLIGNQLVNLPEDNYVIKSIYNSLKYTSFPIYGNASYYTTQSTTGFLVVDISEPTMLVKGYSSGTLIKSGCYNNEKIKATINDISETKIFYQDPNAAEYYLINDTSFSSLDIEGWHYFYAEDECLNRTEVFSFYYDIIPPKVQISSGGEDLSSGSYTNETFSFSAIDTGSGIEKCFYKIPNTNEFQQCFSGIIVTKESVNGWYYFYSVDKSNNVSETISVYLETVNPIVKIYRNNELAYTKTVTKNETTDTNLYFNVGDILKITCETSSGQVESNFVLNENIALDETFTESTYQIVLTNAVGITGKFDIYIVRDMPKIIIDEQAYNDGAIMHFNTDKIISWTYDNIINFTDLTGIHINSTGYVTLNTTIPYSSEQSYFELKTQDNSSTTYFITANDMAGNASYFTITINKALPMGKIISDSAELVSGSFTNKPFYIEFSEQDIFVQYSVNGGEYTVYSSKELLSADATYNFILTNLAGNKSVLSVTINTTLPIGQLFADNEPVENNTITNKKIHFTWDGNISAMVNGNPYAKNTLLSNDNEYVFVLTDFAGNRSVYVITIDTSCPTLLIEGVVNNGSTDGTVIISNPSKENTIIEVYFNGHLLDYTLGSELAEYGDYRVVITDSLGNKNEYSFAIKYRLNGGAVALVFIAIMIAIGLTLGIVFSKKAIYKKKQSINQLEETTTCEDELIE